MPIDSNMSLLKLMKDHPKVKAVLARHGMMCDCCKGLRGETIKRAAMNHGIPLEKLLAELAGAIKK